MNDDKTAQLWDEFDEQWGKVAALKNELAREEKRLARLDRAWRQHWVNTATATKENYND
jgi:hypothetical protein